MNDPLQFTLNYFCCIDKNKKIKEYIEENKYCGNIDCERELDEEDIIARWCRYCNNPIRNKGDINDKYY